MSCSPNQSWDSVIARARKNLSQVTLESGKLLGLPNITSSITSSQDLSSGSTSNNISLSISLPLYSGNKISNQQADLLRAHELALVEMDVAIIRASTDIIKRSSIEKILLDSLDTIKIQIRTKNEKLIEVIQRQKLGQSMFLEFTDLMIELADLESQQVRVMSEIYRGWIDFATGFLPLGISYE